MIYQEPEVWAGLRGGEAAMRRPLPVVLWEEEWAWYINAVDILEKSKIDYRVVMKSENITARKNAIAADFAIGPLPVSQLGDNLEAVDSFRTLPPLPLYSLGLYLPDDASQPAKAFGEFLRISVNYQTQPG
jgi:DNA-binding transcriptional LysR family regulator